MLFLHQSLDLLLSATFYSLKTLFSFLAFLYDLGSFSLRPRSILLLSHFKLSEDELASFVHCFAVVSFNILFELHLCLIKHLIELFAVLVSF